MNASSIFMAVLPSLLVGVVLFYWQRAQKKRDERKDEIEEVNQAVSYATMELANATAIAVTEGKNNGELKRARKAYDEAIKRQNALAQKLVKGQL